MSNVKIAATVVGVGMVFLGTMGVFNAITGWNDKPVERHDVETTGKITHLKVTEVRHAVGVTLNRQFDVTYEFTDENGESHQGTCHNVREAVFSRLNQGDEILVKYHSSQPGINGAPDIGTYVSVADLERMGPPQNPLFRLIFSLGFAGVGALVTAAAWGSKKREAQSRLAVESQTFDLGPAYRAR